MPIATICASHSPLMHEGEADQETKDDVREAFASLTSFVADFSPDLIVMFWPDHFNSFFYDLMPPYCLGISARSIGDWDTRAGELPVPSEDASDLLSQLLCNGVDMASSRRMSVDHGAVQIWEEMFGQDNPYPAPIIPIFINCSAPPVPEYQRVRQLGQLVGKWACRTGKRVLIAGSGGLSHDPPTPEISTAPDEVRERLISGRNPTHEAMAARKAFVLEAGAAAAKGLPPCMPLNPAWDAQVLEIMSSGKLSEFDAFRPRQVREIAGRGANEILTWVAALSAQAAAGDYESAFQFYRAVDGWIAGMGMIACRSSQS
ncbi:3-carboxyethylcatechol 2,3-dioxygenase [Novosphingobium sp. FKTRR1]|uniref:3-carboxyethylcatechol 2,3-dioxygenase n=1 Tax=Novosphingobium sp. FKTRR1 TaxID=2879118 RepID=UPI001CF0AB52|nr:3-carboxyethylcatechol 2,3-dioxygenase [Novosphingobium sp. FKTRR1]